MSTTPTKFTPLKYQEPIIEIVRPADKFGIFAFPGSGKTVISLDKIYQHKEPTLVVAPLEIIYTTWSSEHMKWDFSRKLRGTILHGPHKDQRFFRNRGVYFINPEGLKWLVNKVKTTRRFPWKNLIVDESVKFKNPKSGRFKELCKLLKTFDRRVILSGNPVPNHYLDIWAQIYILDLGERLGKSWYQFRNKYFYPTDYMRFNWELKPGAKEEIVAAIGDITYFLEPDDSQLPERIEVDVPVKLPARAMEMYRDMEDQMWIELEEDVDPEERIVAEGKASAMIKCWQIANGFLYETEEQPHPTNPYKTQMVRIATHHIHDELVKATKNIVEDLQGSPVLIGYHFAEDYKRLKAAFPNARFVPSGSKPEVIKAAERDWNANKIEVLITHINKFSHGLNLQLGLGHHLILYALTYNYDTYDQLIRRFQRQGAEYSNVIVHRLIAQATLHQAIVGSLEHKGKNAADFLLALHEYRQTLESAE